MSESANSTQTVEDNVVEVEVGGVKMEAELIYDSGYKREVAESNHLNWETSLDLKAGERYIKSGEYIMDVDTEHESHWRIELDPNFKDEQGTQYLSVYTVLTWASAEDAQITAAVDITLRPTPREEDNYTKRAGLLTFSKEQSSHGFTKYITMTQLGPLANPKSTEKLNLTVALHILKPSPFETTTVEMDSYIKFDTTDFAVDSKRVSKHTSFFLPYFFKVRPAPKNTPNLSEEFSTKALLQKILEFCHKGKMDMPKRLQGVSNILETAIKLQILPLKKLCQTEILTNHLTVASFTSVVTIAKCHCLDQEEAYPALYKFQIENMKELANDVNYQTTWSENEDFYEELMRSSVGKTEPSFWIREYSKPVWNLYTPAAPAPKE